MSNSYFPTTRQVSNDGTTPQNWPARIKYLRNPSHSPNLTPIQIKHLRSPPPTTLPAIALPLKPPTHIEVRRINDPSHPAHTQFGLFATRHLQPDTLVIPYLGYVHSNVPEDTDATSDYDLSLDREAGMSVDAGKMGNEARMTNDYRGVPRPAVDTAKLKKGEKLGPNVEFRDLWYEDDRGGEKGIGIFVLGAGKSGKRSQGIRAGEEILVNYGRGFWKERAEA